MTVAALKFQVGARTIATVPRRLTRVPLTLIQAMAGIAPQLPPPQDDGYLVTSLAANALAGVSGAGLIAAVRQRYTRYYTDLTIGHDTWLAGLSGQARSTLKRKAKKAAALGVEIRAYRTPAEFDVFHPLARQVSATTYQERLLDTGLPIDPTQLRAAAARDDLRAWLLLLDGRPVAYLCCTAEGETLLYMHVGHDPAHGDLSPGSVLHAAAMRELFADRFRWFDFTEGEGQHKRQFASGGVACVDLLLLRPTLANRATLAALAGFDGAVALAKRASGHPAVARAVRRIRR
ncbi:GNAT family N-acetyltransferase [Sphingomonas sp. MA1305]|uniref:GNAT family N-acetyltransferase n=1 Tax=Sphingomonas sp. MA1305 TaxID=2479204 RepID=UPI0018E051B4|nr:GNAT family N-acetyltransferase [Sphingomonas sp. MA1305]MBI0473913.1 GNAT family N-acetyltransferase [Sphingomonas sp. MA1305]